MVKRAIRQLLMVNDQLSMVLLVTFFALVEAFCFIRKRDACWSWDEAGRFDKYSGRLV